jgi:Transcriptional regulators
MAQTGKKKTLHSLFTKVYQAERKLWGHRLAEIEVTQGQPKMLNYIFENDGCIQKDIAEGTGIEPPSATSILFVMERDGLVSRKQCANDKRRSRVYITEKGIEKREKILAISEELTDKVLREFTEEEKTQFFEMLERVLKTAKELGE